MAFFFFHLFPFNRMYMFLKLSVKGKNNSSIQQLLHFCVRSCKSLTRICTVAAYDNCQHIDVRGGAEILTAHTPDTHTDCNRGNSAAAKQNSKYRVRNSENVTSYNYKEGTYITLNTFFSVQNTSEIFCMGNIPKFGCCIFL